MSNNNYDYEFCDDPEVDAHGRAHMVQKPQVRPSLPSRQAPVPTNIPPPRTQPPVIASPLQGREMEVLYLQLLTQSLDVITEVSTPVTGENIGDNYAELFHNNTNNPVRVQVFADLTTPGCGALLSTSPNDGNSEKYDVLALTANGRTESVGIVLMPSMKIYVKNFQPLIPMTAADVLRVRVFDPMKLLSFARLYPQSGKVF